MSRKRNTTFNKIKKNYHWEVILSLIILSSFVTGVFYSQVNYENKINAKTTTKNPVLDDRHSSITSNYMDEAISSCYYDLYQQNDSKMTLMSGDICNHLMSSYKEICKTAHYDACDSDYLKKYLKGMEG